MLEQATVLSEVVGHVPIEYFRIFWYFIQKRDTRL